jgi:selenocysteine lyase/cysteine desulfurase
MSNIGYDYASALECLDVVSDGRRAAADLLGCLPHEVVFGPSMTALAYELATVLGPTFTAGPTDVVYLSSSEHEANVSPWLMLASKATSLCCRALGGCSHRQTTTCARASP